MITIGSPESLFEEDLDAMPDDSEWVGSLGAEDEAGIEKFNTPAPAPPPDRDWRAQLDEADPVR